MLFFGVDIILHVYMIHFRTHDRYKLAHLDLFFDLCLVECNFGEKTLVCQLVWCSFYELDFSL